MRYLFSVEYLERAKHRRRAMLINPIEQMSPALLGATYLDCIGRHVVPLELRFV